MILLLVKGYELIGPADAYLIKRIAVVLTQNSIRVPRDR
jgi:hypothetical protein